MMYAGACTWCMYITFRVYTISENIHYTLITKIYMSKQHLLLLHDLSVCFFHSQLHFSINKSPAFIQRTDDWVLPVNTVALIKRLSCRNT